MSSGFQSQRLDPGMWNITPRLAAGNEDSPDFEHLEILEYMAHTYQRWQQERIIWAMNNSIFVLFAKPFDPSGRLEQVWISVVGKFLVPILAYDF